MSVGGIQGLIGAALNEAGKLEGANSNQSASFKQMITDYLNDTNRAQIDAGEAVDKFAAGEVQDIHDVMIAMEKGRLSLELILEIRSKLLDAYREMMRMQM